MNRVFVFLAALAAFFSAQARADIWDGPGPQPVVYSPSHPIGNGTPASSTQPTGGYAPAFAREPADIPTPGINIADWIRQGADAAGEFVPSTADGETKYRSEMGGDCVFGKFDPILYPGQAGKGHEHEFCGNLGVTKDSTWASLRTAPARINSGGGAVQRSSYWAPPPLLGAFALRSSGTSFYYNAAAAGSQDRQRVPNSFRVIGGVDPTDRFNTLRKAECIAGAQQGGADMDCDNIPTGYDGVSCPDAPNGGVWANSVNKAPGSAQPWLRNPNGTLTLDCPKTSRLKIGIVTPGCWDGKNFGSPNGRDHTRYAIFDRAAGKYVCPDNWYPIIAGQFYKFYTHNGAEELKRMRLSSDTMPGAVQFNPMESAHFDWWPAWDGPLFRIMQRYCNGVRISATEPGEPHTCDSSRISANIQLKQSDPAPDGSTATKPIVQFGIDWRGRPDRLVPLTPMSSGKVQIDLRGPSK